MWGCKEEVVTRHVVSTSKNVQWMFRVNRDKYDEYDVLGRDGIAQSV
jgi:hypothetical protein